MGVGKYSPTVSTSYAKDQNWFTKNGGDFGNGKNPDSLYDDDGFDSYGYNENSIDRAGISESSYMTNYSQYPDGELYYRLYEEISDDWAGRDILAERAARESAKEDPEIVLLMNQLSELQDIQQKAKQLESSVKLKIKMKYPNIPV